MIEMTKTNVSSPSSQGRPSDGSKSAFEDTIIAGLESVCSFFDNVYFAKSLGIIGDNNILYKQLNKGGWGSKLWLVTLVLSLRRSLRQIVQIVKNRVRLETELKGLNKDGNGLMNDVLKEKIFSMLGKSSLLLKETLLDLFQNLGYLVIVVIDVFKFKISGRARQVLESLSTFVTIIRLFTIGFSTSVDV